MIEITMDARDLFRIVENIRKKCPQQAEELEARIDAARNEADEKKYFGGIDND
ncbi:MAG: hypothetical protein LUG98_13100 [Tannerellaceae bacterium]|nr:hypothetical protein [Tannerellaceae bacterium]